MAITASPKIITELLAEIANYGPEPTGQAKRNRVISTPAQSGKGWLVGDKRLSEQLVERLEKMELVEESFIGGQPKLQLTIVGRAIEAQLQ